MGATRPIPVDRPTPQDIEERKMLGLRMERKYPLNTPPAGSRSAALSKVAGGRIKGGATINGASGFPPTSRPVPDVS